MRGAYRRRQRPSSGKAEMPGKLRHPPLLRRVRAVRGRRARHFRVANRGARTNPFTPVQPLSVWLETFKLSNRDAGAEIALREIGTNALPFLTQMIAAKDTPWKTRLAAFIDRRHWTRWHIPSADENHRMALGALETLAETSAKPAIPALAQSLNDPELADIAALALTYAGPECVWPLADGLASTNAAVRAAALRVLGEYRPFSDPDGDYYDVDELDAPQPELSPDIPALVRRLKDSDPKMRGLAAECLGFFHEQPALVIPALLALLNDQERLPRMCAIYALANFRQEAKPAAPALLQAINHEDDFMIRTYEFRWLRQIDPDTKTDTIPDPPSP